MSLLPGASPAAAGAPQERERRAGGTGKGGAMDLPGPSGGCTGCYWEAVCLGWVRKG